MSRPAPTRERMPNGYSYDASPRERVSLTVWYGPGTAWQAAPSGRRGRQRTFSDATIQACQTIKLSFGLPPSQTTARRASPS